MLLRFQLAGCSLCLGISYRLRSIEYRALPFGEFIGGFLTGNPVTFGAKFVFC